MTVANQQIANHTHTGNSHQDVRKIDETSIIEIKEYCLIEDALTEVGKEIHSNPIIGLFKKSALKFQRVKSNLLPFWLVEATHTLDYEYQTLLNIPINEINTKQITINGQIYDVKNPMYQRSIEVPAIGTAHYEKKISRIFDANGVPISNDSIYRYYIERHNSDRFEDAKNSSLNELDLTDKIPPVKLNIERKIISEFYQLTKSMTDNTQDVKDIIEFTTVNLYYHPIFTFEYLNTETNESKEIEVDGITGKVIKDNMISSLKNLITKNRDPITEISAEIVGSFVPGTGYIVRELGKRV